jgi:hypothetical protein
MICRCYGELDAQKFKMSWVPLIYYIIVIGSTFSWDNILSFVLGGSTCNNKAQLQGSFLIFHMSSYLLDVMCVVHAYPQMGWAWKPSDPPIHIYYKVLWEHKYSLNIENL